MKDLALRLAALDPDASAALRVIARFDHLSNTHAGLTAIVREAATLARCPVRLVAPDRRLSVRIEPDGGARSATGDAEPTWPSAPVPGEGAAVVWLERPGPAGLVEAMVLERAAAAAATALARTRDDRVPASIGSSACVGLVTDATVPERDRLQAARRLGLAPDALARAVAVYGAAPYVEQVPSPVPPAHRPERAGIGPAVGVLDLPSSLADARTALRFTAEGTHTDPGPRIVAYEELGGLVPLAAAVRPGTKPVPDVRALDDIAATLPWALTTLAAVVETDSLRTAAATLPVHHSTLQYRLTVLERQLGWTVRDPKGRLRLQLALILRRLHRNPG